MRQILLVGSWNSDLQEKKKVVVLQSWEDTTVICTLIFRVSWIPRWGFWSCQNELGSDFVFGFSSSKLLGCKQKIIDLLPEIEVALNNIKEADNSVMQMQGKRQREIWHLLKIACVSSCWAVCLHFLPVHEPGGVKVNSAKRGNCHTMAGFIFPAERGSLKW